LLDDENDVVMDTQEWKMALDDVDGQLPNDCDYDVGDNLHPARDDVTAGSFQSDACDNELQLSANLHHDENFEVSDKLRIWRIMV